MKKILLVAWLLSVALPGYAQRSGLLAGPQQDDAAGVIAALCEQARKDPDPCRLKQASSAYSDLEKQACLEANKWRAKNGLQQMALNDRLQEFARSKADEMIAENKFHHDTGEFINRLQRANLIAAGPAENIAAAQPTAAAVFQAWMNSPGHRENLLNPNSCVQGIAAVKSNGKAQYPIYWVHEFAVAVKQ